MLSCVVLTLPNLNRVVLNQGTLSLDLSLGNTRKGLQWRAKITYSRRSDRGNLGLKDHSLFNEG